LKRKELIKGQEKAGCILKRQGGRHDWYENPNTGVCQPIPRHNEINENLSKHIRKMLGID
jgi:predicted RNA binding protein YcfA (HicA-like mRNA interferase family)